MKNLDNIESALRILSESIIQDQIEYRKDFLGDNTTINTDVEILNIAEKIIVNIVYTSRSCDDMQSKIEYWINSDNELCYTKD